MLSISIITTTYNRKDLVLQTIDSVQKSIIAPLNKKSLQFEHIIYDDVSTDNTKKVITSLNLANLIYIQGSEHKGQSYGQNQAIQKAKGDYIFLLDSDDLILQRTLLNFAQVALLHPDVNWFVSDFLRVDAELHYQPGQDYYGWKFENYNSMLKAIFNGEHFIQSNVFFKKEIFYQAGMFDEELIMAQDLDLYIRFLLKGNMPLYCNFISHLHRIHASNLSQGVKLEEHLADVKKLREKYSQQL